MNCINGILNKKVSDLTNEEIHTELNPAIIVQLQEEFAHQDRGGLYGQISKELAYNSNRIEGSKLSEEETESLFDTQTIRNTVDTEYRPKDVEEMNGHFLMFNKMLTSIESPLSISLIKQFHFELEAGVFSFRANGYIPGEFKKRKNTVARITTTLPTEVPAAMKALFSDYAQLQQPLSLTDLLDFHVRYERIHPFQDGNGRTGRIILFRECLKNGVLPFIIHDDNKTQYYQALNDFYAGNKQTFLDLCQKEQATFFETLKEFMYDYSELIEENEENDYERG